MRQWLLLMSALGLTLTGCGINRAGLARDVRQLLANCNVKPKALKATMGNRTRTGIVEFSASVQDVTAIVNGLALQESETPLHDQALTLWLQDGASQYDHPLLQVPADVKIYRSTRRQGTLRIPGGVSFEYLLLFWDEANSTVLLQLSYAYG